MNFTQIVQNNWYLLPIAGVVIAFSVVFNVRQMRRMKSKGSDFLSRHPNAAKVYLTKKGLIVSEVVDVYSVNGEEPAQFTDGTSLGFYVLPGKCTVEISYTYTRPGVIHKTVSKSTDVVEKVLETEPRKSYVLGLSLIHI